MCGKGLGELVLPAGDGHAELFEGQFGWEPEGFEETEQLVAVHLFQAVDLTQAAAQGACELVLLMLEHPEEGGVQVRVEAGVALEHALAQVREERAFDAEHAAL